MAINATEKLREFALSEVSVKWGNKHNLISGQTGGGGGKVGQSGV